MTRQEADYRRVLRLLPAGYRQTWEDDMVDTFLLSARKVSLGEIWSVLVLSVRLHVGGSVRSPRPVWWQAVQLVILLTLVAQIVVAATEAAFVPVHGVMPARLVGPVVCLALYAGAFVALLLRGRGIALTFAVLGLVLQVGQEVTVWAGGVAVFGVLPMVWPLPANFVVIALFQVIAIPLAFRRAARTIRPEGWAVVFALAFAGHLFPAFVLSAPWLSLTSTGLFVVAVGLMVVALVRAHLVLALAAVMTAIMVTLINVTAFTPLQLLMPYEQLVVVLAAETVAFLALGIPLVVRMRLAARKPIAE